MDARLPSPLASVAARALGTRPRHLQRLRLDLADGAATTLHVATYDLARTLPRVHRLAQPTPLERWCREHRISEAMVGGFFVRPGGTPLGELRTRGIARVAQPFDPPWDGVRACLHVDLDDGAATTLHVATYDLARTLPRVHRLAQPTPLERWCREHRVSEAVVGGFFVRPDGTPLGELRTRGIARVAQSFDAPWDGVRACLHVAGNHVTLARRDELPDEPTGDLLQAGPLLVRDGVACVDGDVEGFSAGQRQFDSDITAGRYPRSALAVTANRRMLAVACDGRADDEAGLSLGEMAEALVALGARAALNLDGGGSTSLVCAGRLRNVPREDHGIVLAGGRPVSTVIAFTPR